MLGQRAHARALTTLTAACETAIGKPSGCTRAVDRQCLGAFRMVVQEVAEHQAQLVEGGVIMSSP